MHRMLILYTYNITLVSAFCILYSPLQFLQLKFHGFSVTVVENDYVSYSVSFLVLLGPSFPRHLEMSTVFLQDTQTHGSTLKSKATAVRPTVHLVS